MEVYVLMADTDGTMRSRCEPIGIAVKSKEAADRFVKEGSPGYFKYKRAYQHLIVFEDLSFLKDRG